MPGLGLAGATLGTVADVQALNADLESMGLPGNVSFGPSLASNMSFGLLGESPVSQFGNIMGFDALAEAPLSSFSNPVGPPSDAPPSSGGDGGGVGFMPPAQTSPFIAPTRSAFPASQFLQMLAASQNIGAPRSPFGGNYAASTYAPPATMPMRPMFNLAPQRPIGLDYGGLLSPSGYDPTRRFL
jgi:hypothetical protein